MRSIEPEADLARRVCVFVRQRRVFILWQHPIDPHGDSNLVRLILALDGCGMPGRRLALQVMGDATRRGILLPHSLIDRFCRYNPRDLPDDHGLDLKRLLAESE